MTVHRPKSKSRFIAVSVSGLLMWIVSLTSAAPVLTRVPDGGIQPQALATQNGITHLVYFKGKPEGGDLFYATRAPGATNFTSPIQVDSKPGSAVAIGTIRGAQIAAGKSGRIHIVWNGASEYKTNAGVPLFYTRLNSDGTGFEPERNVMTWTKGLDGGASIAADRNGDVYIVWHGMSESAAGEEERAVFLARSNDDGRTFERERRINSENSGACACCGLKAFVNAAGNMYVLYRAARGGMDRDEILLCSTNGARTFAAVLDEPWKTGTCPMSSAWLSEAGKSLLAGWETKGQVRFQILGASDSSSIAPASASVNQKYPVCAMNTNGQMLLAWCEGIKWGNRGTGRWRILNERGTVQEQGSMRDLPSWSFAAVLLRADGRFEIVY
jgi:hypothetical protein